MKLYYMTGTCSLASYIALNEAGIKFEAVSVDRKNHKAADGEDFNAINTKGYVPALRLDNGELLTENVAVLQYIADRNPAAKLAPPAGTLFHQAILCQLPQAIVHRSTAHVQLLGERHFAEGLDGKASSRCAGS